MSPQTRIEKAPLPTSKEIAIDRLQTTHRALRQVFSSSSAALVNYRLGNWGINDILAHLIGWNYLSTQAIHSLREGKRPDYFQYDTGSDWEIVNRELVEQYKIEGRGTAALLHDLEISQAHLLQEAEDVPEDEYDKIHSNIQRKGRTWTIFEELNDLSNHTSRHAQSLESWHSTNH